MKTVIAINGSPRKNFNTAALLKEALRGAADAGAQTELIHLSDLNFRGCMSCFGCKRKGNPNPEKCCWKDDLSPVLEKIAAADAILIGSPIYLFDVTGPTRSFIERLLFPHISYDAGPKAPIEKPINCGFIFTQNHPSDRAEDFASIYQNNTSCMRVLGGKVEQLIAGETYQFDDYSKYACSRFDEPERRRIRDEVFPKTLAEAYAMGQRLIADE